MNEPSYEFGDDAVKERIERHGYIKYLARKAKDLGYNITINKPFISSMNPKNPTATTLIKKDKVQEISNINHFACPVTIKTIERMKEAYYSKESNLLYPVISEIPIFLRNSALISFHYGIKI